MIVSVTSAIIFGNFSNIGYSLVANEKSSTNPFASSIKSSNGLERWGPTHPPSQDDDASSDSRNVIVGTNGDDFIRGTSQGDIIYGLKGDDQIYGLDGSDTIIGGQGNDIVDGGPGNDKIYGNTGNDFLAGNTGSDMLAGGVGDDILRGRNAFTSEAEPDSFNCGPGQDTIDDYNAGEGDQKTSDCE
jgi:Ca2+-binding RTX toxin-like protein